MLYFCWFERLCTTIHLFHVLVLHATPIHKLVIIQRIRYNLCIRIKKERSNHVTTYRVANPIYHNLCNPAATYWIGNICSLVLQYSLRVCCCLDYTCDYFYDSKSRSLTIILFNRSNFCCFFVTVLPYITYPLPRYDRVATT